MSADNWAVCPQCRRTAIAAQERREKIAEESYGKVPAERYLSLLHAAEERAEPEPTLREDYGLGIKNDDGIFYCHYKASCRICGFAYEFDIEKKVPLKGATPK